MNLRELYEEYVKRYNLKETYQEFVKKYKEFRDGKRTD